MGPMRGPATAECYAECREVVRRADKDRYLATLFVPADRRDHIYALYAFNAEVAQVREKVSDALPGEVRLQWWSEALAGCGHGEVMRHPVAAALIDTLDRCDLAPEPLIDLLEARAFDLYDEPMATMVDLETYLLRTAAIPFHMATRIIGAGGNHAAETMAHYGGVAYGLAGLLRALAHHAAQGKVYIPEEVLARHGVAPHDILIARRSESLDRALAELRAAARDRLDRAAAAHRDLPSDAAAALLPLALVRPYLDRMERRRHDPFADGTMAQWRRQWVLWRAARRAG